MLLIRSTQAILKYFRLARRAVYGFVVYLGFGSVNIVAWRDRREVSYSAIQIIGAVAATLNESKNRRRRIRQINISYSCCLVIKKKERLFDQPKNSYFRFAFDNKTKTKQSKKANFF